MGYYNKLAPNLALLNSQLKQNQPNTENIATTLHQLGNSSLGGTDHLLAYILSINPNILTKENQEDFQELYDIGKVQQEILTIFKIKVFDYLAQVKEIKVALPAVFGKLEAIANNNNIDSIKQAVTEAVTQLRTILKPFLPQAATPQS